MPSLHLRIAGLTLILLGLWGATLFYGSQESIKEAEMVVEHALPAALTITRTSDGVGLADIRNDSDQTLFISLPSSWIRDEVRGATLASVIGEEAAFGFRRWSIPAKATVSFDVHHAWNALLIRSVSDETLRAAIITVDIARGTTDTESYLVQDELQILFP